MSINYIEETSSGIHTLSVEALLLTQRKIFIEGVIDENTVSGFSRQMMYLSRSAEPVNIYINSPGGRIDCGLAIYDIIQSCTFSVNMYCIANASSMAALLLASGKKGHRFILPHANVMIHEALMKGDISGSATSISRLSESIVQVRDIVNGILAKHTGKTLEEINRATSFDNLMNAKEAIEFGICDEIADSIF